MSFFEFPHTRTYDNDLGWLIFHLKKMSDRLDNFINLNTIKYADPIYWSIVRQYEANTVVIDPLDGTAYLSTQPVPSGVSIGNTDYWTPIFNYGANMDELREQIVAYNEKNNTAASRSYQIGDMVWIGDKLFRILTNIAAGTAFVEGTNIAAITVETAIREREFFCDTVADIDSLESVRAGDLVRTMGYHAISDGGASLYRISSNNTPWSIPLANGLNANIIAKDFVTPEMFGAKGDGATDDAAALNNAMLFAHTFGLSVSFSGGRAYLTRSRIIIYDNQIVDGNNSTLLHPDSFGFVNEKYGDNAGYNYNIVIRNVVFDGGGGFDGHIKMTGIRRAVIDNVTCQNGRDQGGVTTGISFANGSENVRVTNSIINDPDYGLLFAIEPNSVTAGLINKNIFVDNCTLVTKWGSAVAFNQQNRGVTVSNCKIYTHGDTAAGRDYGLGIKCTQGNATNLGTVDAVFSNNLIVCDIPTPSTAQGITMSNYWDHITIADNIIEGFLDGIYPNYENHETDLIITGNELKNLAYGIRHDTGTDKCKMLINGNKFIHCRTCAFHGIFWDSEFSDNEVRDMAGRALNFAAGSRNPLVANNRFTDCEGIPVCATQNLGSGANFISVVGNIFKDCGEGITEAIITLNDNSGLIVGNRCTYEVSGGTKPAYFLKANNNQVVCCTGNWLYGFATGYYNKTTNSYDVIANNVERGL